MVALLRADGRGEAALRLEELWDALAHTLPLSILCAYPMTSFSAERDVTPLLEICAQHSHVTPAESYAAFSDLDEGVRPSARLQEAAARLVAIVESSDDAIVGKDLNGVVTSWNRGAEGLFGFTANEMIGRSISQIIPADCTDDLETILSAVRRGERVDHYETQRLTKDGERIDISLTVSPIKDSRGKVVGASKIARDITQRKSQEVELRKEREALDTLQSVALALTAELDLERLLQAVTDAAKHLAGASYCAFFRKVADHEDGHFVLHALSGASLEAFERFRMPRNTAAFAPAFSRETTVRLDDITEDPRYSQNSPLHGTPTGHSIRSYLAVPITGRDTVFGGLFLGHPSAGVFKQRDERIVEGLAAHAAVAMQNSSLYEAERRLRNAAERASQAKDEFLAMLGHELRNPLASIRNAALAAGLDASRKDRSLGIIRRGADQLARLVDDLLDAARITQGKISLQVERLPFAGVVGRAVDATRQLFEERAHRVTVSFPRSPLDLDGDQTRLEQVVVNLLTNAAKYTEHGGFIEVTLTQEGQEGVLRVRDNGVGIAREMLPRVFDLFAQGERELDRAPGGLGIGLTVVRRIVELHEGRVEAHSDGIGTGAEFVVRLPVSTLRDTRAAPPEAPAERLATRVLLVEDNADAAEGMMMLLELRGHRVEVAHDGITAIALAAISKPDVLLVDIGLPGIDGYEVARRVRRDPQIAHVVLVALTGYGRAEDKRRAFEAGFDHHLTKPVALDALNALMAKL